MSKLIEKFEGLSRRTKNVMLGVLLVFVIGCAAANIFLDIFVEGIAPMALGVVMFFLAGMERDSKGTTFTYKFLLVAGALNLVGGLGQMIYAMLSVL